VAAVPHSVEVPSLDRKTILDVQGLRVDFRGRQSVTALDGIDLTIGEGEILGLVGESGSGKTVLSLSLLRLIASPGRIGEGAILWNGRNLLQLNEKEMQRVRGREMAMIFQNPLASLNPVRTVKAQFMALLRLHHDLTNSEAEKEALGLLREVGIPDPDRIMGSYAFQLSGGLCQRVMIAMAISCRPKLLIADEPTASLDTTIQAQIMDLLLTLRDRLGMAILLVSHDLGVIARLCDRVAVMYLGRIVEVAEATELYEKPLHPYTQLLLRSVPVPDPRQRNPRNAPLAGDVPSPSAIRHGACRFEGRCPRAIDRCRHTDPQLMPVNDGGRSVACIHYES
jgi:oligopeptide/dipeptide ABC transporter ATP-binding protein